MRFRQLKQIVKVSVLLAIVMSGAINAATPATQVKFAIEPKFITAEDFADGLAKVGFGTSTSDIYGGSIDITSYGYIDRTGKLIISDAKIASDGNFSQGLAVVGINTNRDPNPAISRRSCLIDNSYRTDSDCRYGYIDKTGKTIIAPQFTSAGRFSEGLAPVTTESRQGYIDRTGKMVLELKYPVLGEFSEGMASVGIITKVSESDNDIKYGYIDRTGKLVIPLKFFVARNFSQGLAIADIQSSNRQHSNLMRGYINKQGKFVIKKPELDTIDSGDFHEGMASVDLNGGSCSGINSCSYDYLDRQGKVAIAGSFTAAKNFAQGLAPVATGGGGRDAGGWYSPTNWGFINKQG